MAEEYTFLEMADMHLMYGLANCNRAEARRLYSERFPNRNTPNESTFVRIHNRLRETGSFAKRSHDTGRTQTTRTLDTEHQVLQVVEEDPTVSTRKISALIGIDHQSVWRILKSHSLYPYHIQRVQALLPTDYPKRRNFSVQFLNKCDQDPMFLPSVLFTDEAGFCRNGIFNFHNNHIWADENPHSIVQSRHQHNFTLNVWIGIIGDHLIGPVFLPLRLNGASYLHFLQTELWDQIEFIPLHMRNEMWFMHDGAPPHFSINVRAFLDLQFENKWIGRGGPIAWPARSPDLNPIDFYVWGHLKSIVYKNPVDNVEDLRYRIEEGCDLIRSNPGIFHRVRESTKRRIQHCIAVDGRHIENVI